MSESKRDFVQATAIQQLCGYLWNEHGNVTREELREWVETWLDTYCPPEPNANPSAPLTSSEGGRDG